MTSNRSVYGMYGFRKRKHRKAPADGSMIEEDGDFITDESGNQIITES